MVALAAGAPSEDLVTSLPGFENLTWSFKVYSGFLDVPGPLNGYDSLKIHYQFQESQRTPASDPVVAWNQGGPGGSSILTGLYGEMGVFQIGEEGNYLNPYAWNRVANMLYMESPAGSGGDAGYSMCFKGDNPVDCHWDDVSQAEAYAHTLKAFFKKFPEFQPNPLYLTGESYFGQYGPNIATFIYKNNEFKNSINLKGMALGNACWGGNDTCVACNGPSEDALDVDLFFGKGLYSPKLREEIRATCSFPTTYVSCDTNSSTEVPGHVALSEECKRLIDEMHRQVGPYNVYNLYDNCPRTQEYLRRTGKSSKWLQNKIRRGLYNPMKTKKELLDLSGGYRWDCGGHPEQWIQREDVRRALHLDQYAPGLSQFFYILSGPASITLYPELVRKVRLLIYNGDADACVPLGGNEKWIGSLEAKGILREVTPWTPWFAKKEDASPSGAFTNYKVDGDVPGTSVDFSFWTVRLAGHMVPQYQPERAFEMIRRFLAADATESVVV